MTRIISVFLIAAFIAILAAQTRGPETDPATISHGVSVSYQKGDGVAIYSTHLIEVGNRPPYYSPPDVTIGVGDLVQWINKPPSDTHTAMEMNGHFGSSDIASGSDWCYHFAREGDYPYVCRFHPWMKGVIHVRKRVLKVEPVAATESLSMAFGDHAAVAASDGTWWTSGDRSGAVVRRNADGSGAQTIQIGNLDLKLVPLLVDDQRLVLATRGQVIIADPRSAGAIETIALPEQFSAVKAAEFSKSHLLVTDSSSLVVIDLEKRTARKRGMLAGARIVAMQKGQAGEVWAVDAGRRLLLRFGDDWTNEIPMPSDMSSPRSLAVDAAAGVWFSDDKGAVAFRRTSGSIEQFETGLESPELVRAPGADILISSARGNRIARVLPLPAVPDSAKFQASGCPEVVRTGRNSTSGVLIIGAKP